jgi:RNA polymerase sigma-70 factor (ECF subfamily)
MSRPRDNNLTDYRLIETVQKGNAPAFGEIIKRTEKLVAQILFKMISNPDDRKDLAQDIYLKAFKNLAGFRFEAKLSTWIAQISYNTCINHLQKKKLVILDQEQLYGDAIRDDANMGSMPPADDSFYETEQLLRRKELTGILNAEIDKLSPLYKTLITLYHQEGFSYAEMASVTSLPEGTVKNYLFRARKALKENLLNAYKKEDL